MTASNSCVMLISGAQACKVFHQVGSSATLRTGTTFVGTIMTLTSISATTNATVQGRLLARYGAVTLDSNVITRAACAPVTTKTTTRSGSGTTAVPTTTTTGSTTTTTVSTATTTASAAENDEGPS